MASKTPCAEEKKPFLFAYHAPTAFQIHFCLTINCLGVENKFMFSLLRNITYVARKVHRFTIFHAEVFSPTTAFTRYTPSAQCAMLISFAPTTAVPR